MLVYLFAIYPNQLRNYFEVSIILLFFKNTGCALLFKFVIQPIYQIDLVNKFKILKFS